MRNEKTIKFIQAEDITVENRIFPHISDRNLKKKKRQIEKRRDAYVNVFRKYHFLTHLSRRLSEEITQKANKLQAFI